MIDEKVIKIAIGKVGGEILLSNFIGNGNMQSGVFKLIIGYFGQKYDKELATGVIIDGIEDILNEAKQGFRMPSAGQGEIIL